MEIVTLNPKDIKIKNGLERFRKEAGEILDLLKSIDKYGQLQPIVITREKELIAGGRRLGACLLGKRKIHCVYIDTVTDTESRLMEIEENYQRKDFTPAEDCLAIAEIHKIQQKLKGIARAGSDTGWGTKDTAIMLGRTKSEIAQKLRLAKSINAIPELKKAKTIKEMTSVTKALEKIAIKTFHATEADKGTKNTQLDNILFHLDSTKHMKELEDNSIDILFTDPPYGINIDKIATSLGKKTGGINKAGKTFDDSRYNAEQLYTKLAIESKRFCKETSHAFIFVAPDMFEFVRSIFISQDWEVYVKPLIWIKGTTGQCNMPVKWPSSCYEMIMYARMPKAKLYLEGKPDWIQVNPMGRGNKYHPTQKPIELIQLLLRRVALPGQMLYDPFAGSGSFLIAGLREKLEVKGCEEDKNFYTLARNEIRKELKK